MNNMIIYDFYTDIGTRKNNEDCVDVCVKDDKYLFVVADGLGGHDDGEVAASFCIKSLVDSFENDAYFDLTAAIQNANLSLLDLQTKKKSKMKTTVAVAFINGKNVTFSHIGDSRIYAFRDNAMVYQSEDHSVAQTAVLVGEISKKEIRTHCDRNQLTQVLGAKDRLKVDLLELTLDDIDSFILCTDGFWELITEDIMISKKNSEPKKWLDEMVSLLKSQKNIQKDNNTALIVSLT